MKVSLNILREKGRRLKHPKQLGECLISYDAKLDPAVFAEDAYTTQEVRRLQTCLSIDISANGVMITGLEDPCGDKRVLYYQEWWCITKGITS